jgi:hypothetical protein
LKKELKILTPQWHSRLRYSEKDFGAVSSMPADAMIIDAGSTDLSIPISLDSTIVSREAYIRDRHAQPLQRKVPVLSVSYGGAAPPPRLMRWMSSAIAHQRLALKLRPSTPTSTRRSF